MSHTLFAMNPLWLSSGILVLTYAVITTERLNRAIVAGVGACLMIATGVIDQETAIGGVDFNTIMLLAGMMLIVGVSRRSGMFQFMAIWTVHRARGRPAGILFGLAVATALMSALLDNVTTILLVVPVTLAVARELRVAPYPFLVAEVLASNIGGTATLIGDPPNILIGSQVGLSFNQFVTNLGPVVLVILLVTTALLHLRWGRALATDEEHRQRVLAMNPQAAITDPLLLRQSLGVLAAVVAAFVLARGNGIEPGTIAMFGAAILVLLDNWAHPAHTQAERVHQAFGDVEWITLFFFIGLFVIVAGVEHAGLLDLLGARLTSATQGNLLWLASAVLWGSALLSAALDNIPFVATMIPLLQGVAPSVGGPEAIEPLWWALSLGACLGGNATLVGASANLTAAGLAERDGVPFRFWTYTRSALSLTFVSILIAHIYLLVRYL